MEWYNVLTLSLSAFALLGSVFTYLVHDKKLKTQQSILNDLQIKKLKKEIEDGRSVEIRPSLINVKKSYNRSYATGTIFLKNFGKAEARDVIVYTYVQDMYTQLDKREITIKSFLPGEQYEIPVEWSRMGASSIKVMLVWLDVAGIKYSASHTLPLY